MTILVARSDRFANPLLEGLGVVKENESNCENFFSRDTTDA
jgi:hypothetical protein